MITKTPFYQTDPLRQSVVDAYRMDETVCVQNLLDHFSLPPDANERIEKTSRALMETVRVKRLDSRGLESFLYEYDLSSEEGIALMCMAEALLRIPDKKNINNLIRDKVTSANWAEHVGSSESFTVNAATWGLMLTGKVLEGSSRHNQVVHSSLKKLLSRSGEPFIRGAVGQAMKIMSRQFVMGRTIGEAIKRACSTEKMGYRYSYDMLGEAALTADDAQAYFDAYHEAITAIGEASNGKGVVDGPGVSVKLSALHPRYEISQTDRVIEELVPKLFALARHAKEHDIALTVDAEEAVRLDLSIDVIERVFCDPGLHGWEGFGLALQTYQKRAWFLIDYLADMARRQKTRMKVRLIKGAYWDSEIKRSQEGGYTGYPVFTRKASTDLSFLACSQKVIGLSDALYPQFATHNVNSVATVLEMMGDRTDFEFQCLHGMGQVLYDEIVPEDKYNIPCRIYAPVGSHEDLLPYLVRRLLENGANSSFVNQIADPDAPIDKLIEDVHAIVRAYPQKPHPHIPLPRDIFKTVDGRENSKGLDLSDFNALAELDEALEKATKQSWMVGPIVSGVESHNTLLPVYSPADHTKQVGQVQEASDVDVDKALAAASNATGRWDATLAEERARILEQAADLYEKHMADIMALAILEAGKTIEDAVSEVREAVDFCRYYAAQCRQHFSVPKECPGYTGEVNTLSLHGRGVITCISPWNFPAAIFTGQVVAALAAGNAVMAKPAEQTPLIAGLLTRLLHAAGVPDDVLHLLPGRGDIVGAQLVSDPRVKGVVFTGSTETARIISKSLADRPGPITPLIAETGGQNCMIVDSSALLEQVTKDVIASSFKSAGQRCSALRVLFVQEEIADPLLEMIKGAMAELRIGDPSLLSTDVGPVIDHDARAILEAHCLRMRDEATLLYQNDYPDACAAGTFVSPALFELNSLSQLPREVFGPICHVIRYKSSELQKVIDEINQTGYGLTFGLHSRIAETIEFVIRQVKVGNCYINRNMIGAIVGVQPFGGEGLSGTGPKAGGPHYLMRLCTERSLSVNTTAVGGNASLMSLDDEKNNK